MTSVVRITKNTILCESRKVYEEIFIGDTQFKQLHMTTVTRVLWSWLNGTSEFGKPFLLFPSSAFLDKQT